MIDARSGLEIGTPVSLGRFPTDVAAGVTDAWTSVAGDGVVRKVPAFIGGPDPDTVRVGGRPEELALDRRWLWVTDAQRDVVTRVNTRGNSISGGVVRVPGSHAGCNGRRRSDFGDRAAEQPHGLEPR